MTFQECLLETANHPELFKQFCRLKGYRLARSPIEQMVDEATGYTQQRVIPEYADFVFRYIYLPVFGEHPNSKGEQ